MPEAKALKVSVGKYPCELAAPLLLAGVALGTPQGTTSVRQDHRTDAPESVITTLYTTPGVRAPAGMVTTQEPLGAVKVSALGVPEAALRSLLTPAAAAGDTTPVMVRLMAPGMSTMAVAGVCTVAPAAA